MFRVEAASQASESKIGNLRTFLAIAAWLGVLAGFGEGLVDLLHRHYHAPPILCVTLLADTALFLALGFGLWLIGGVFGRKLGPLLAYLILFWVFAYYFGSLLLQRPGWVLTVAGILSFLTLAFASRRLAWSLGLARRGLRWTGAAALICLVAIPAGDTWRVWRAMDTLPAISPGAPNVLLVIIDTLRADHLSCYGYKRPTSPNIDRLARQGVLFEQAIAASSWTLPSHATMMTGTYPHVHHTVTAKSQLPRSLPTLASTLRKDGYRTAAFSANTYFFDERHGFGRGFIRFGGYFLSATDALERVHFVAAIDSFLVRHRWTQNLLGRQTAADINRAALNWVDSSHRPFFLTLNYLDVHDPYVPPQPWRHRFSRRLDPGGRINIAERLLPKLTPAELQDEVDAYDGGIAYADDQLGLLLKALAGRGRLDNTLVVLVSDHGEAFGVHGLIDHANALYYPLIHVPLIFRWPGHVPKGVRISRPISTKDIGATILALLHRPASGFPGESLAALWTGQANPDNWPLPISELAKMRTWPQFPDHYGPLKSIVMPDMQYIVDPRLGGLLYDWKTDPREVSNLLHEPADRKIAATLSAELKSEEESPASKDPPGQERR